MIKCIECGKELIDGGTRYATPVGQYCRKCWEKKDQKFKDERLKRAMYGLDSFAKAIADAKKGGRQMNAEEKLKKAEEAAQIRIADLSIENNRLRTKLKDLEKVHSDFLNRCFWLYWLFWILLVAGVVAGMFLAYFLFK